MLPYLSNIRQSVAIANRISPTMELHYGVPQGSVIVPILFVIYIQPFSNRIKRHSLRVHLFAGDIQTEASILPSHVQNLNCTSLSFGQNVISFSTTAINLVIHFADDI